MQRLLAILMILLACACTVALWYRYVFTQSQSPETEFVHEAASLVMGLKPTDVVGFVSKHPVAGAFEAQRDQSLLHYAIAPALLQPASGQERYILQQRSASDDEALSYQGYRVVASNKTFLLFRRVEE